MFEYTAPYGPKFNGRVERKFPTLYGKVITTFIHTGLEFEAAQKYWCECTNTLLKKENMLVNTNEKLEGRISNCSYFLWTFGEMAKVKDSGSR